MKKFGCIMDFTLQRNDELMKAFRNEVRTRKVVKVEEIAKAIVNSPASRFWVSEERACAVTLALMANKPILDSMRPTKREMFAEIYKRVCKLRKKNPSASIIDLVSSVVNSPAPKFYMLPSTAQILLQQIKRGCYDYLKKRY